MSETNGSPQTDMTATEFGDKAQDSTATSTTDDGDSITVSRSELEQFRKQVEDSTWASARRTFEEKLKRKASIGEFLSPQKPATNTNAPTAAQPTGDLAQLVELMKLDLASRMADRVPRAPEPPAPSAALGLDAAIAGLDKDAPDYTAKAHKILRERLKRIKLTGTPGGRVPKLGVK
jgi:hypothetical protein